jgi:hypothetical protein
MAMNLGTATPANPPFHGIIRGIYEGAPAMLATSRGVATKGLASMHHDSTPSTYRRGERITFTCQTCGESFDVRASQVRHRRYPPTYCSKACRNTRERKAQVALACEHCGESFTTYRSEVHKAEKRGNRVRFCSVTCRKAAKAAGNTDHVCEQCGTTFTLWASHRQTAEGRGWIPGRFCSAACYEQRREQYRIDQAQSCAKPCETCGLLLAIRDDERLSAFRRRRACSPDCQYRLMMTTRLGREPGARMYPKAFSLALKALIRERDGFTCQECGVIEDGRAYDVHHIDYDKTNCHPRNLITLCRSCHARTNHKTNRDHWEAHYQSKVKARAELWP